MTEEPSMPQPFTVVVADFLDEPEHEEPVLKDVARIVLARATASRNMIAWSATSSVP
jgi:hypothetical protein